MPGENYAGDSLINTVESTKTLSLKKNMETLCKEHQTIHGIEEKLPSLRKIAASDSLWQFFLPNQTDPQLYSKLSKGKDLDGNDVDDSLSPKTKLQL